MADEGRTEVRTGFACLDVDDPLVAWLVYRGEMVSASAADEHALSFWTTRYLERLNDQELAQRIRAEVALEQLRNQSYPDAVSRLRGFYVFADAAAATNAAQAWPGFPSEQVEEVGLRYDARSSRHDAEWITHNLDSQSRDWMHRYLAGDVFGTDPIWELIVDGRALVFGTSLRMRAYETVKATWPRSLALLEIARLAAEVNSDFGHVIATIVDAGGGARRVRYAINFEDATDPAFFDRLDAHDGPRNTNDLAQDELVLPDLTDREFTF